MANYDYVADASFRPFSMQEMLTPLMLYKDAYDKQKAAYDELEKGADVYSYLGEALKNSPESKAAKMYNDFANELNKANDDFSKNGLSISNSRSLLGLKRQYNRDIRRIEKADEKLQELNKQRRALAAAGKPMLYANDNPTIDDMLEGSDFNDYSINGDDLYVKGVNTGKAFSARLFDTKDEGSTLKGYYRKWVESQGYDPDTLNEFQEEMLKNDFREVAASIPELRRAIISNLEANGVYGNLTGKSLRMAEQQYLNGVIDGAIYKKDEKLVKDESKMSAAQMASNARQMEQLKLSARQSGYELKNGDWVFNPDLLKEKYAALGLDPNKYEVNPLTGKVQEKSKTKTPEEKEQESIYKKAEVALLNLNKKPDVFRNNKGFEVQVGNENRHYKYIGAMSKHGDSWEHGAIGQDVPGRGWGFTSSSNVMSPWGNFSASNINSEDLENTRILADNEIEDLQINNPKIKEMIQAELERYLEEEGLDEDYPLDWKLIEVPNENGNERKGYIVAIREV